MLEKFLTVPQEQFSHYLLDTPEPAPEKVDTRREAYRYSKVILKSYLLPKLLTPFGQSQQFIMRSQLDGVDHRLPGTGVFDIKTRAALPIRLDLMNHVVCCNWNVA